MDEQEFRRILKKYRLGEASPEERKIIDAWYDSSRLDEAAHEQTLNDELGNFFLKNITDRIVGTEEVSRNRTTGRQVKLISFLVAVAASLFLIILVGQYSILPGNSSDQAKTKSSHNGWEIKTNSENTALSVSLPDGSNVILEPNSTIRYLSHFKASKREVYLDGEGFFEVAHNKKQPFVVYAKQVTAKVLGTTFTVRAFRDDKEIVVAVRTGRVSVDTHADDRSPTQSEVILTPNTEIIYNQDDKQLAKRIVETPLPLLPPEEIKRLRFVDAPVREVFEAIEKIYGVDLVFDPATFASCVLTTSVSDGGIYKRLDIISDAIELKYAVVEDKIVITGKGCN
jgi:ferric-dicitrate binding protein FerR (iron transport regulator)